MVVHHLFLGWRIKALAQKCIQMYPIHFSETNPKGRKLFCSFMGKYSSVLLSGIICDCECFSIIPTRLDKSPDLLIKAEEGWVRSFIIYPMDFPFSIWWALMMHFLYFFLVKKKSRASSSGPNPFFPASFLWGPSWYSGFLGHNHYFPSALNTLNNGGKDAFTLHKENCIFTKWGQCYHLAILRKSSP